MRPRILAEGEAELLEAALWYEDRREGLGMQFYESILDTCEAIGKNPARFPKYESTPPTRDVRRALVNRFPFVVIFEIRQDEILILAVAHTSRDSGYWRNR